MTNVLSEFMHIWEVEVHFKCPVVGAMLSVERHKRILKKCGYDVTNLKPYEYHQIIMSKLHGKNDVSIKTDNYIRGKARRQMIQIAGLTEQEIRPIWNEHLKSGKIGPMMYAIAAHRNTRLELLHDVHGEVHMQSHANMRQIFDTRQKLTRANEIVAQKQKKLVETKKEMVQMVKARKADAEKIEQLEVENRKMKKKVNDLEILVSRQKSSDLTIRDLEQENRKLEQHLANEMEKLKVQKQEKQNLQNRLFSAMDENEMVNQEMQALIRNGFNSLPCDNGCLDSGCPDSACCKKKRCAQPSQCYRRVFMIGGIPKMQSLYKNIVEKSGGKFDYHDGYLKKGNTNLEARIKRCDVVLCPVNCNSHNACIKVKKLCYRHNKQLKILNNSSLHAVTQALVDQENQRMLN